MLVMVNVGVPRFTSKHNVCMTFKPLPPRGPKNHGIPWLLTQRDLNTILGSDISFWDKSTYFEAQWSLLRKKNNIWVLRPTPFISWALLFSCNGCLSSIVIQLYDLLPPLSLKAPKVFSWPSLSFNPDFTLYRPSTIHSSCQLHFILNQNRRLRLSGWAHGYYRLSPTCRECSYVLLGKICSFDVVHVVSHIVVVHCCTRLSLLEWC